jgi:hypothetical protein
MGWLRVKSMCYNNFHILFILLLLVLTTAVIFFSIFEIFTLCSYIVDYVYFLLLEPCYFLTLLHYSGQYFSVKELNVLHKYNSLVRDLLKISLWPTILLKRVAMSVCKLINHHSPNDMTSILLTDVMRVS